MSRTIQDGTWIGPLDASLLSCPVTLRSAPAIIEAWEAYRWYDRGALADRYPLGIPVMMARALIDLDAGYSAGTAKRIRDEARAARAGRAAHDVTV